MSRDIFVQDILSGITDVKDIPSDWMPDPLRYSHGEIVATIQRVVPSADFSDPDWGYIEGEGFSIEVNINREEPMRFFAFQCRAGGPGADYVVADILEALGLRAFDIDSKTSIFEDPRTRSGEHPSLRASPAAGARPAGGPGACHHADHANRRNRSLIAKLLHGSSAQL